MKYFTVTQNNSGGYMIENEDVGTIIIVQATTPKEAQKKLDVITANYSEYCQCCGERWGAWWNESDGTETPMIYDKDAYDFKSEYFLSSTVIYHMDGRIERLRFDNKVMGE